MTLSFPRIIFFLTALFLMGCAEVWAQQSGGRLFGKVTDAEGKPVAGVIVTIVNQTNSKKEYAKTRADGSYGIKLSAGAYRISVERPFEARFERGKAGEYGVFSNVI